MPKIHVEKPFTLTHSNGMQQQFRAGGHDVPQEVAEHWYVQAHLAKPESAGQDADGGESGGDETGSEPAPAPRGRRKPQGAEGGEGGGDAK